MSDGKLIAVKAIDEALEDLKPTTLPSTDLDISDRFQGQ
jgi:hypothetical protein